jgi:hypothetical protein
MFKLKTKWFAKWAKKHRVLDETLANAIRDAENNLSTAHLGGGLYKVRVAAKGFGKRSAYRTIIAFRINEKAVFLYGFAKNDQENLSPDELRTLKKLAHDVLALEPDALRRAIDEQIFIPIKEA